MGQYQIPYFERGPKPGYLTPAELEAAASAQGGALVKKVLIKGAEIGVHVFRALGPVGDILAENLLAPTPLNTIEAEQEARMNADARDREIARAANMAQGLTFDAAATDP